MLRSDARVNTALSIIAHMIAVTEIRKDPARRAAEEAWLKRLNAVRARYHELRNERARNSEEALRKENAALREYKRVLILFTNLIMHGTMPLKEPLTEL